MNMTFIQKYNVKRGFRILKQLFAFLKSAVFRFVVCKNSEELEVILQ